MENRKYEPPELETLLFVFELHKQTQQIWLEERKQIHPNGYDFDVSLATDDCVYDEHWDEISSHQRWLLTHSNEPLLFNSFEKLFEKYRYCEEELIEMSYENKRKLLAQILADPELVKDYNDYRDTFANLSLYRAEMHLENSQDKRLKEIREN